MGNIKTHSYIRTPPSQPNEPRFTLNELFPTSTNIEVRKYPKRVIVWGLGVGETVSVHIARVQSLGKPCGRFHYQPMKYFTCRDFTFEPNDKIILQKAPLTDAENQLYVRYFAMPTQNACEVDKLLFDRYHDVVVNGALAQLLLMRQYAFADPQMAMMYDRYFKQGIAQAKIDVMRHFETGEHTLNHWGRI